jgi:hypothetical protein
MRICRSFGQIDLITDSLPRLHFRDRLDVERAESGGPLKGTLWG